MMNPRPELFMLVYGVISAVKSFARVVILATGICCHDCRALSRAENSGKDFLARGAQQVARETIAMRRTRASVRAKKENRLCTGDRLTCLPQTKL